jgi:hypothetical protein
MTVSLERVGWDTMLHLTFLSRQWRPGKHEQAKDDYGDYADNNNIKRTRTSIRRLISMERPGLEKCCHIVGHYCQKSEPKNQIRIPGLQQSVY